MAEIRQGTWAQSPVDSNILVFYETDRSLFDKDPKYTGQTIISGTSNVTPEGYDRNLLIGTETAPVAIKAGYQTNITQQPTENEEATLLRRVQQQETPEQLNQFINNLNTGKIYTPQLKTAIDQKINAFQVSQNQMQQLVNLEQQKQQQSTAEQVAKFSNINSLEELDTYSKSIDLDKSTDTIELLPEVLTARDNTFNKLNTKRINYETTGANEFRNVKSWGEFNTLLNKYDLDPSDKVGLQGDIGTFAESKRQQLISNDISTQYNQMNSELSSINSANDFRKWAQKWDTDSVTPGVQLSNDIADQARFSATRFGVKDLNLIDTGKSFEYRGDVPAPDINEYYVKDGQLRYTGAALPVAITNAPVEFSEFFSPTTGNKISSVTFSPTNIEQKELNDLGKLIYALPVVGGNEMIAGGLGEGIPNLPSNIFSAGKLYVDVSTKKLLQQQNINTPLFGKYELLNSNILIDTSEPFVTKIKKKTATGDPVSLDQALDAFTDWQDNSILTPEGRVSTTSVLGQNIIALGENTKENYIKAKEQETGLPFWAVQSQKVTQEIYNTYDIKPISLFQSDEEKKKNKDNPYYLIDYVTSGKAIQDTGTAATSFLLGAGTGAIMTVADISPFRADGITHIPLSGTAKSTIDLITSPEARSSLIASAIDDPFNLAGQFYGGGKVMKYTVNPLVKKVTTPLTTLYKESTFIKSVPKEYQAELGQALKLLKETQGQSKNITNVLDLDLLSAITDPKVKLELTQWLGKNEANLVLGGSLMASKVLTKPPKIGYHDLDVYYKTEGLLSELSPAAKKAVDIHSVTDYLYPTQKTVTGIMPVATAFEKSIIKGAETITKKPGYIDVTPSTLFNVNKTISSFMKENKLIKYGSRVWEDNPYKDWDIWADTKSTKPLATKLASKLQTENPSLKVSVEKGGHPGTMEVVLREGKNIWKQADVSPLPDEFRSTIEIKGGIQQRSLEGMYNRNLEILKSTKSFEQARKWKAYTQNKLLETKGLDTTKLIGKIEPNLKYEVEGFINKLKTPATKVKGETIIETPLELQSVKGQNIILRKLKSGFEEGKDGEPIYRYSKDIPFAISSIKDILEQRKVTAATNIPGLKQFYQWKAGRGLERLKTWEDLYSGEKTVATPNRTIQKVPLFKSEWFKETKPRQILGNEGYLRLGGKATKSEYFTEYPSTEKYLFQGEGIKIPNISYIPIKSGSYKVPSYNIKNNYVTPIIDNYYKPDYIKPNIKVSNYTPAKISDYTPVKVSNYNPVKANNYNPIKPYDYTPVKPYVEPYKPPYKPDYVPPYIPPYVPPYIPPYEPPYVPPYTPPYNPPYNPDYTPSYTPTKPDITPPPKTPPLIMRKPKMDESKQYAKSYDVYIRKGIEPGTGKKRRIEQVLIDKALPYNMAIETGLGTAATYAQRTAILKPSKKQPQYADIGMPNKLLMDQFRALTPMSKIKKGREDLVFVEKSKYAIDSFEEKKGIPYKAQQMRKEGLIKMPQNRGKKGKKSGFWGMSI